MDRQFRPSAPGAEDAMRPDPRPLGGGGNTPHHLDMPQKSWKPKSTLLPRWMGKHPEWHKTSMSRERERKRRRITTRGLAGRHLIPS